jgi:regulator of cell morphogenesis and NO signaling
MQDLLNKTLARIVIETPRAAAVFERYQLDFCCKGKRRLSDVCSEKGVDPAEITREIKAIHYPVDEQEPSKAFSAFTLTELIDHIVTRHHSYTRKESAILQEYLAKLSARHGFMHPELNKIAALFTAIKEEMELHMQKEENVLFPRIKEMEERINDNPGSLHAHVSYYLAPITMMEQEHDHAGEMLAEIHTLSRNYAVPPDACTTYHLSYALLKQFEEDFHLHVHLENNILFPKSLAFFQGAKPLSVQMQ